ncbi:Druantia anti-phage system protein DruA [Bythopirellula goksoeyrii]|uniref:Uncharacterized protein n=1 Tax=Bythopirellula goksoeyrii TaxID=1400387 RepID=A0A5B9QQJ3_9BACT|nr:Druantia anti-phage system protein DruA [Bythopirellula goksoeyrii]QEG36233.1 hypothetical protein Pr1d_35450 [Bythopirellula goksoeyrii]
MAKRANKNGGDSRQLRTIPLLTVEARLKRTLRRHLKSLGFTRSADGALAPPDTSKEGIRRLHAMQRAERIQQSQSFIDEKLPTLRKFFANGREIAPSRIMPRLELIEAGTEQSELFRLASLTWAVPVSQGYGRRMRFLVWDDHNGKLIGIFALGDPVFNLRVRDQLIGWDSHGRRERLVNVLDAFVLGAVPPYNMLLGGKLIASLIRTREVVDHFALRYRQTKGVISGRMKKASLVMVTTSSSLGRSSIYNRLKLDGQPYFENVGFTQGWGHFHIPDELFGEMREYLKRKKHKYAENHRFGQGPNWKMRAMRESIKLLGENPDILCHRIFRELYICELASNATKILRGEAVRPNYRGLQSAETVSDLAIDRWVAPRAARMREFRQWRRTQIDELFKPMFDSNGHRILEAPMEEIRRTYA